MKLSDQNADKVMADAEKFFHAAGVARKDIAKLSLVLDESLIQ